MLFMFNHISTIERDDDPYNSDYIIFLGCGSTTKQMWDCSHTKKWQVFLFVMLHDVAFSLLLNPSKTSIGWCVCVRGRCQLMQVWDIYIQNWSKLYPKSGWKVHRKTVPQTEWLAWCSGITWKLQQQFQIFRCFAFVKFVCVPSIRGSYWGKKEQ